jgi:hypothetical protein
LSLPRDWAAILAPLLDKEELRIEGVVDNASDGYNIPILLELFAPRGQEVSMLQELEGIRIHDPSAITRQPNVPHPYSLSAVRTFVMPISPPRKTLNRERGIQYT